MSDLIRREDALNALCEGCALRPDYDGAVCGVRAFLECGVGVLLKRIENIKAVDAVEVVRCDTCEYYHPCDIHDGEIGRCLIKINRNFMECNGYCSLGARKDGGEKDERIFNR